MRFKKICCVHVSLFSNVALVCFVDIHDYRAHYIKTHTIHVV